MLTIQTSVGFLLTLVTIQLVGPVADLAGWAGGFSMLAIGPMLGDGAPARPSSRSAARRGTPVTTPRTTFHSTVGFDWKRVRR